MLTKRYQATGTGAQLCRDIRSVRRIAQERGRRICAVEREDNVRGETTGDES